MREQRSCDCASPSNVVPHLLQPPTTTQSATHMADRRFRVVDFASEDSPDIKNGHRITHRRLTEKIPLPNFTPRTWQSAVAHELIKGQDVVLKAGTGSGKTLSFQAVCLLKPRSCLLVISPLNALMEDQVKRARELGIRACCVNAETLGADDKLIDKIRDNHFQMVIVSAEFTAIDNEHWKRVVGCGSAESRFSKALIAIVVDEAHLVREWKEFRPHYRDLGKLRARWRRVPILACSGTLPVYVLHYVHESLGLRPETVLCELDTDRANITVITAPIPPGEVGNRKTLNFLVPEKLRNLRRLEAFN